MTAFRRYLADQLGEDPGDITVVISFDQGGRQHNGSLTLDVYGHDAEGAADFSEEIFSASGDSARAVLADFADWTPGDSIRPGMRDVMRASDRRGIVR